MMAKSSAPVRSTQRLQLRDLYNRCNKDFLVIARCGNGLLVSDLLGKKADGKYFSLACHSGSNVY